MRTEYKFNPEGGGCYFVSFATVFWVDVFTRPAYKEILLDSIRFCQKEKGLILHAWCIMTSHVHLIFGIPEGINPSFVLRDLKKFTSAEIRKAIQNNPEESRREWMLRIFKWAGKHNSNNTHYQFWQQDNHPIVLRTSKVTGQKLQYVHNNPVVEQIVTYPEEYLYSSARDYSQQKGLLDVEIILLMPI